MGQREGRSLETLDVHKKFGASTLFNFLSQSIVKAYNLCTTRCGPGISVICFQATGKTELQINQNLCNCIAPYLYTHILCVLSTRQILAISLNIGNLHEFI